MSVLSQVSHLPHRLAAATHRVSQILSVEALDALAREDGGRDGLHEIPVQVLQLCKTPYLHQPCS